MIEESETPEMGSQSKAGDVLAERRARRDAASDPATLRRAEAAESVVRNLETHLAALEERLEEVGRERERIAEKLGDREREVVQIKQGEYAEQQLRVEAEERNERAQREMRAQVQALNERLDETERSARELSGELEDVQRELSESQQAMALGERLRERSEELRERMAALEGRFGEMQQEVAAEREARRQSELELAHLRERDARLTPIVGELMEVAAELRSGFEHELASLREELQRQVVWERETYVRELTAMGSRMEDLRFELARTAADLRTQLAEPPPAELLQPNAAPESEREAAHRREMADALVSAVDRLRARVAEVREVEPESEQPPAGDVSTSSASDAGLDPEADVVWATPQPSAGASAPVQEPPVFELPVAELASPAEPPVVEPPVVEPPVVEPPVVESASPAEPPVAEPPVAEPPVAEPPVVESPVVEPPVAEPASPAEPPVAEPPVVEPPVAEAPVVESTAFSPPVVESLPVEPADAAPSALEWPVVAPTEAAPPTAGPPAIESIPPIAGPPATEPPFTALPTAEPPFDESPVQEPPAVEAPVLEPSSVEASPVESVEAQPGLEPPAIEVPVAEPLEPRAPPRAGLSPAGVGIKPVTAGPVALQPRPMPVPATRPSWLAPAIRRLVTKRDAKLAAELIIELIPAQQQIVDSAMHYQMKVDELGTFHVALESGHAVISREASSAPLDFILEGSAAAFSELAAGGASRKPSGLRIRKGRRRAKRLIKARRSPIALADLASEGIDVWPGLLLLVMAEAIDPAWTTGRRFELAFEIQDVPGIVIYVRVCDGEPIVVSRAAAKHPVATISVSSHALICLLAGMPGTPDHKATVTGDSTSVEMFLQWGARAQGLVGSTL